ncbi:hypothetical protein [Neorhodopirellula pilleata]|uniref:Uncharacterized protein n=1 Tax=Neorhodopirellula pilleata TaxID=2714738 RepID=A0A5C6A482_9BACT|nr:hypothetical protein [Neorhodopirellula pilleata]TWT94157.1 hypothetical protein Pla100_37660 [Neorhodopirellula pilleata]
MSPTDAAIFETSPCEEEPAKVIFDQSAGSLKRFIVKTPDTNLTVRLYPAVFLLVRT